MSTIQRNTSDAGREQTRKAGEAISALKIPVGQVLTAQFCRTRDTGVAMGSGLIELAEEQNHQIGQRVGFEVNAAQFKLLAEAPAKETNRILVSHTHGSPNPQERTMGNIQKRKLSSTNPILKAAASRLRASQLTNGITASRLRQNYNRSVAAQPLRRGNLTTLTILSCTCMISIATSAILTATPGSGISSSCSSNSPLMVFGPSSGNS